MPRYGSVALFLSVLVSCGRGAGEPPAPRPTANEEPAPEVRAFEPSCDEAREGAAVPFARVDLHASCDAAAESRDHETRSAVAAIEVVSSEAEYRERFGCDPDGSIDFARERLATYTYVRSSSDG
jgi:hypothetical protein